MLISRLPPPKPHSLNLSVYVDTQFPAGCVVLAVCFLSESMFYQQTTPPNALAGKEQEDFQGPCLAVHQCCFVCCLHAFMVQHISLCGAHRMDEMFYGWVKLLPSSRLHFIPVFSPKKPTIFLSPASNS